MAYSFLARDCRVTLRDGTPTTPITKTFAGQLDDVALKGLVGNQREWQVIMNKDGVHSRRKGKVKLPGFNLSNILDKDFADAAGESLLNWIERRGPYTALVSVDADSDGFVMSALLEWLDDTGAVADSVVLGHVHCEEYGLSPGESYVNAAEFVSTGTLTWA